MSKSKKKNGFSLTVVVIFMAVAAIFVGYLLGSWLIQFLNEDETPQIAENQVKDLNSLENNMSQSTNNKNKSLELTDKSSKKVNKTAANDNSISDSKQTTSDNGVSTQEENINNFKDDDISRGNYGIQIGAFANYENAQSLKKEIESKGYSVIITNTSPHKVQIIGYNNREEAEKAEKKIESSGYNGFIVSF